jgi:hypothetical protein
MTAAMLQRFFGYFEKTEVFLRSGDENGVLFGCLLILERMDDVPGIDLFRRIATRAGEDYLEAIGFDPVAFAQQSGERLASEQQARERAATAAPCSTDLPIKPHEGLVTRVRG